MIINIKVFWLPVKYRFYGFASEAQMEPTVEVCFSKTLANNSQSAWIDHEYHEAEFSILSQIIICSGWSIMVVISEDSFVKPLNGIVCEWLCFIYHLSFFLQSELFKAFEKTRLLVGDKKESQYSRCGRTDKGVSSVGQVSWCTKE